jgi:hypothetical protein
MVKLEFELNRCASASRAELRETVTLSAKAETTATVGSRALMDRQLASPRSGSPLMLSTIIPSLQVVSEDAKMCRMTGWLHDIHRHSATRRN